MLQILYCIRVHVEKIWLLSGSSCYIIVLSKNNFKCPKNILFKKKFQMPLEMSVRTLPTTPEPPDEVRADPLSPSSVHLRWNPKYPPNGKISVFTVRIGSEENGNFNWRKRYWKKPDFWGYNRVRIDCIWKYLRITIYHSLMS